MSGEARGEASRMGKQKFARTKPHVNVGTIGHVDHGKTSSDGGDHQDAGVAGAGAAALLRQYRQCAGGAGAGHHHRHRARRVRDREAPLRPCRLPGACRLHQEHDHRGGADGRGHPGGERAGRPDAPDAGAHPAGAASRSPLDGGLSEQSRHARRRGAAGAGGAGGARVALGLRVSGR